MIEYPMFYRKFGIRRPEQVVKPRLFSVNAFFLPFNSAVQYVPEDETSLGIGPESIWLQNYKRLPLIQHVEDLSEKKGNPRIVPVPMNSVVMKYHASFRRARRIKDMDTALKDRRSIIVINHAMAPMRYKYMETNFFTPYNQWYNQYATLWDEVQKLAKISDRQQFIQVHVPEQLPPVSLLMRAEKEMTRNLLTKFDKPELLALLDIWTWLGENRKDSIMNRLTTENFNKVNLVWFHMGRWCLLNLGTLDSWREGTTLESNDTKVNPFMLQRRFLRMVMSITEAGSVVGVDEEAVTEEEPAAAPPKVERERIEEDNVTTPPVQDGEVETIDEIPIDQPAQTPSLFEGSKAVDPNAVNKPTKGKVTAKTKSKMDTAHTDDDVAVIDDNVTTIDDKLSDADVNKDLEQLEKISDTSETPEVATVTYKPYIPPLDTPEAGVIAAADKIAKSGMLSAAEHRRFVKLASRYKEIPNPFTKKGTLAELTVITPEETMVPEKVMIADKIKGVADPSMLSSSLKQFDSKYIQDVLPKDIVSMTLNVQKAGVAVQDYKVEKVMDINDEYEVHTLKLTPVIGSSTTVKFRVPVIDENGVLLASGVKYRIRKQRGDVPIRKIGPDEVALTSYYSKLFIARSERSVFNYPNWLLNQITSRGIDENDPSVTDIQMTKVFDSEVSVPRTYSIIAQRFGGFQSGKYTFFFNYHKRNDFFGEKVVKEIESKSVKLIPVGKGGNEILVMDLNSDIHAIDMKNPKGLRSLGDIEKIIGIDKGSRPIEMAEIGIFAKAIPVVFVLGHEMGLGNLLATLGTKVRRVAKRSQYTVEENEYSVHFNDEVLIFDRNDRRSMLIFGGLNRYKNDVKKYSVYQFDKREVYQTILENNSLGARYTREFDLMFKMWVDHITKEVLLEMKEPTDLVNLIIRSCELLTHDQHPSPIDNNYMRDKGYERVAGIMYGELVKAMRVYNARPANASATVDLNPNAVWNAIAADPTTTVIEESNPIHNLKEKEVVVYRGAGGRSSRSMVADTRVYHRSSMGVVSEATTDNADVGTVIFLSADPNYKSLRGTIRPLDKIEGNAAKLMSPSALLAPGAENDDWKLMA